MKENIGDIHEMGVGVILSRTVCYGLMAREPILISPRIVTASFNS